MAGNVEEPRYTHRDRLRARRYRPEHHRQASTTSPASEPSATPTPSWPRSKRTTGTRSTSSPAAAPGWRIINGQVMTVLFDAGADTDYFRPNSLVGLQIEQWGVGRVDFRNIWVKRLPQGSEMDR